METILLYLELGFKHILPLGFDHILFIVALFLLSKNIKTIVWQATVFTVAHSITLALAATGKISIPSVIVEPVIALSIVFVAIQNIVQDKVKPSRLVIIFVFGLIHGLGFAGVLKDLGVPANNFFIALLSFNIGVELGQLTVIGIAWLILGTYLMEKPYYRTFFIVPISIVIALIGLYWCVERLFLT